MPTTLTRSHLPSPGLRQFDAAETAIATPEISTITVQGLLIVEGKQTDSEGNTTNYTKKLLKEIVAESNKHRNAGERIPLLEGKNKDHEYAQGNVIGDVVGAFTLLEITEELLPHPGMTDLIGKMGIFAPIKIAGEENVVKYFDGRLKKLSVGIAGKVIWEVSAVVWGAIEGASLYADPGDLKVNDFVEWSASGGTARGRIEEIATEGTLTASPSGTEMEGSEDNPAFLTSVWREVEGSWEATDTTTVHRADALTKVAALQTMRRAMSQRTHALTIAGNLEEIALRDRIWEVHRVWDAFTNILYELLDPDSEETEGVDRDAVLTQAIADLAKLLQQKLDLTTLTFSAITAHALTIAAQLQEDQESADDLWWAFKDVLKSIEDATAAQLGDRSRPQWMAQAVDDLAAQIRLRLQISADPAPLTPVPLFSGNPMTTTDKQTYSAEDFTRLEAQTRVQQRQINIFAKRDGLLTRYTNLRLKGDELRRSGKLTPASHKAKFGALPAAIATYSSLPSTEDDLSKAETDLNSLDAELSNLEYHLNELEQHGAAVKFGTYTGDEPLPDPDKETTAEDAEADEFLKDYTPTRSY